LSVRTPDGVLAFAFAFAALGLYTLRAIRMGVSTDLGWKAYSALELVLPAAAGGLLFLLLRLLFRHAEYLFTLLTFPLVLLFGLVTAVFGFLLHGDKMELGGPTTEAAPPEMFEPAKPDAPPLGAAPPGELFLPDPPPVPWGKILAVLAILAALVLLVIYLRRGKRGTGMAAEHIAEERFQVFRRRQKRPPPKDQAERVRRCYAAYLCFLEVNGQSIGRGDTSLDILTAPKRAARATAEEETLRRLYLAARYGGGDSVSAADAEEAERCLETIRAAAYHTNTDFKSK
jgi:hypothetical protein